MGYSMDTKGLQNSLENFMYKTDTAVRMYGETAALRLEGYAKKNAPWTDRTGDARKRLKATLSRKSSTVYRITLAHGVNYGVYLELAHNKKYATIAPTINHKSPEILKGLNQLLDRMR